MALALHRRGIGRVYNCCVDDERGMMREQHIHAARVYLAQSHQFTSRARGFSFVLLQWAANARRRAVSVPVQRGLF